jgi:GNAT superfamily N-acetyltransferase
MSYSVKLIEKGETHRAVPALRVLWPQYSEADMARYIDEDLRENGYHLVGMASDTDGAIPCVIGYRVQHSLWLGKSLYIVDMATLPEARGQGLASKLLEWIEGEARRRGCGALHLDSGVGADRSAAHRVYMENHYRIACHHFLKKLDQA